MTRHPSQKFPGGESPRPMEDDDDDGNLSQVEGEHSRLENEIMQLAFQDLRGPLNVIQVCCDYLESLDTDAHALSAEQREFVARIQRNSERALHLVSGMIDLGADAGQVLLHFQETSLRDFLDHVVERMAAISGPQQIDIVFAPEQSGNEIFVPIDRERMERVFENVLRRAYQAARAKDRIELSVRLEPSSATSGAGTCACHIAVIEEGTEGNTASDGVPRVGSARENSSSGRATLGAELRIARQYVEFHHGTLSFESHATIPGSAGWVVRIPGARCHESQTSMQHHQTRILVVDDDEDIRQVIVRLMQDQGFEVFTGVDGVSGMREFQRRHPHLVISDIKMPNMDGFELLQAIKSSSPNTPVILASGFYPNLGTDIAKSVFRADKIISKPFDPEGLVETVASCIPGTSKTPAAKGA